VHLRNPTVNSPRTPDISAMWPACMPLLVTAGLVSTSAPVAAQQEDTAPLEEIVVTVTPLQSTTGLRREQIAYHIQSAFSGDIASMQTLHLGDFLNRTMQSVSINDAQNNPLQPDVSYRGFTASPLLGLAQGLAVYQNGVRINEPLGDTVNWDLLPASAVQGLHLIGGANPLFGLNTLGGALSLDMKDGFTSPGHNLDLQTGSFGRAVVSAESGGSRNSLAWYGNVHYFDEDGWRDESPSDAANFYGSLGWRGTVSSLNINGQYGASDLTGNGAVPAELLQTDRDAIFTAPDITENSMYMVSMDGSHRFTNDIAISGNVFYRRNKTDSFNGDTSEFAVCRLGSADALLEGLEEDDLEELGLDDDDVCDGQFADAASLESFLNNTAIDLGEEPEFNIDDLSDELSGTGVLSDSAINNTSTRVQRSYGSDVQLAFTGDLFERPNQLIVGSAWFVGTSTFDSLLELADLDPETRSTAGLGTGTFVDEAATSIKTDTTTWSLYLTDTIGLGERLSLTVSGRFNRSRINLEDQSGERPELNGKHTFNRLNPAVGLTYQFNQDLNFYGSYSESSRAPTPVELACNDHIFELAAANAAAAGEDPEDVEFECRLPNAFLADPPLEQVVAKSFELGVRGNVREVDAHLGIFHTTNDDDIIFQTTGRATGLFANVDKTRRRGLESGFSGNWHNLDWFVAYSYVEATFEAPFEALSPNHPLAGDEGTVQVHPGDRMPGIPDHHLKIGGDYLFSERFGVGADLLYNSGQRMRGDESGQLEEISGYGVLNLRGHYRLNDHLVFYASVNNLLDTDYETFGLIGEEPAEVEVPAFSGFTNPRFFGPGAPRAAFVGIKLSL
jgi:iron complex outermembrane recepter protein